MSQLFVALPITLSFSSQFSQSSTAACLGHTHLLCLANDLVQAGCMAHRQSGATLSRDASFGCRLNIQRTIFCERVLALAVTLHVFFVRADRIVTRRAK